MSEKKQQSRSGRRSRDDRGKRQPRGGRQHRSSNSEPRLPHNEPKTGNLSVKQVEAAFVACGRCSFFVGGYAALHGRSYLHKSYKKNKDNVLELAWTTELRPLVERSYGIDIESDTLFLSGSCRECGRTYSFENRSDYEFAIDKEALMELVDTSEAPPLDRDIDVLDDSADKVLEPNRTDPTPSPDHTFKIEIIP